MKRYAMWAGGAVVTVIFALVVLQLLRDRGIDPVAMITGWLPRPAPMRSSMDVAPMAPAADAAMVA